MARGPSVLLSVVLTTLMTACGAHRTNGNPSDPDTIRLGWYHVQDSQEVSMPSGEPIGSQDWEPGTTWRLVNFWASTCGPCRTEMPALNSVSNRDDIQVVGVSRDQFEKFARQFENEVGATFPSWMDSDGVYAEQFIEHLPRNALPVSALIREDSLVAVHLGPIDDEQETFDLMATEGG